MREIVGVIAWVVAGLIAGWLAGVTMKGGGYGRIGDIAVGLVGAFAGAWVFVFVAVTEESNAWAWEIAAAAAGAVVFVLVARLVTRNSARRAPQLEHAEPSAGPR